MKAFLATRKGLLVLKKSGTGWDVEKNHFEGVKSSYIYVDEKNGWVWGGLAHGHWGAKLHLSKDKGRTFEEIALPKFPEGSKDTLKEIWALKRDSKNRLYMGVAPSALFYSDDHGKNWKIVESFYKINGRDKWFGGGTDDHCLHSILIDPKDDNRIIVGISVGGTIESQDRGQTWEYSNKGLKAYFMPNHDDPIVQDPHLIEMSKKEPNVLWQQNHCGIFKSDNFGHTWIDVSKGKGIASAFGWAIVIDEKDPQTAFTIPALSDETRVPVGKKLLVQKTTNGGKTWKVLNKGLPQKNCYDIVYRHAFDKKAKNMIFGCTSGHIYFSSNEGNAWKQLKYNIAPVYAVKLGF